MQIVNKTRKKVILYLFKCNKYDLTKTEVGRATLLQGQHADMEILKSYSPAEPIEIIEIHNVGGSKK